VVEGDATGASARGKNTLPASESMPGYLYPCRQGDGRDVATACGLRVDAARATTNAALKDGGDVFLKWPDVLPRV
jgi:hypothetical protein